MSSIAEKIRAKLGIDEAELLENMLDRAKKFIGLTKDGRIVFRVSRAIIPTKTMIALYAVGKYFASLAGYSDKDYVTVDELSKELGIPANVATARLSDLRAEGRLIGVERGTYKINTTMIDSILAEIENYLERHTIGTKQ